MSKIQSVLFVCTGNICRSPTADGVFRHLLHEAGLDESVSCDSAGLLGYHEGDPADPRTAATARAHGYDLDFHRARQVRLSDFEEYDLILAMDRGHLRDLQSLSREAPRRKAKLRLFLEGVPGCSEQDVPDPYYGGASGFEKVLRLIEQGCQTLLQQVQPKTSASRQA